MGLPEAKDVIHHRAGSGRRLSWLPVFSATGPSVQIVGFATGRSPQFGRQCSVFLVERSLPGAQFVITSKKLLMPCYENHDLDELATFSGLTPEGAVQRLQTMVKVVIHQDAMNILSLSCEGTNPSDTALVANAVAAEFIEHEQLTYDDAFTKLQDLLKQAVDGLNTSLGQLDKDYAEFDLTSRLTGDGINIPRQRHQAASQKISILVIRQKELAAELQGLEQELKQPGGQRQALLMLIGKETEGRVGSPSQQVDTTIASAKSVAEILFPLLMKETLLAEEVGADYPKLVSLRKQIEITRRHLDAMAGLDPQDEKGEPAPTVDFITVYLSSLRSELVLLQKQQAELQAYADEQEDKARDLRADEHTRNSFIRRIAREESLLEDVQQQFRKTELPSSMGGVTASVLTEATDGDLVYPKLPKLLGLGAFLGGLAGLVIGYVVEMADRSFRKPEEIVREFGIPILGHVPFMQEKTLRKTSRDVVVDRTVISLHQPQSRPAEAFRTVRTSVCFSALGKTHRVIQVTSPMAGDGKSTLAANFAVLLAQSGKKTLLLESDFRRPKIHQLTGVDNNVGVVDVLRGDAEVADAIKETELEDFHVLPCGSRPRNPAELLTRPEYEQLLQVLREKFDYVIVDSPPVLVVADPCSVGSRADGVLLCVRLHRHTRDYGRCALERLRDVGANMIGIVINCVEDSDRYGYGSYSYSEYSNDRGFEDRAYFQDTDEVEQLTV